MTKDIKQVIKNNKLERYKLKMAEKRLIAKVNKSFDDLKIYTDTLIEEAMQRIRKK